MAVLLGGLELFFLADAVKPKYGGIFSAVMQYGGKVLAVGGFSFFGGNDFGGRRYYQNVAVNRQLANFTAGKIPTTTLIFMCGSCTSCRPPRDKYAQNGYPHSSPPANMRRRAIYYRYHATNRL